ncbi:DNA phosphorothioation-associated putative methyltransferase [Nocardioides sp. GY 10113]|uniref:DNA phosphorothioation-associated putative methyltransferase n=1 Tax=Nocardioides sp. GY 10113 TaxID=2569761 RepID=UPI0010A8D286|nr:DNA phosphorothioation-associated putative methyltransferase [Nocardioides sp. GY 10113]TIC79896.1 DNA phosphorothioation-associated putative methyltransferase [Nocardioides sp. GY 10113]
MTVGAVARHKTALTRVALSRPMATAMADGLLPEGATVFDYGCGKGDDLRHLRALGYPAEGWDPTHRPNAERRSAAVVNLGFVVNVIEHPRERREVLRSAWELTEQLLVISARMTWDGRDLVGRPMGDGLLTRTGTFQKFYDQNELAEWIESSLDVKPFAAAPGIFYVFRDEAAAQRFVASRVYTYRPRMTIDPQAQYEANQQTLAPLLAFMQAHARPPRVGELPPGEFGAVQEALGSLGKAQRLIRQVTDDDFWDRVTVQRRAELLIYVALSRFGRRPRFSQLDSSLAADIRALFGTYQEACLQADRLLLACGDQAMIYVNARGSQIGKQTPSALYVHRSAMAEIPPVLQVYEGCARVLAGTIPSANMVKLSVTEPQVSYLTYPRFDRDPHPTLRSAITVNLRKLSVEWRDYSRSENPPLLHRKEEFLGEDDPRRPLYSRLTRAEMRAGLYEHPELIGTAKGWQATLAKAGVSLRGHRLVRSG